MAAGVSEVLLTLTRAGVKLHATTVTIQSGLMLLIPHGLKCAGTPEVMTLLTHAEVKLRIKAPGGKFFRLSWYQGIEGFTGWHAGARTPGSL